jgi:hypothetical protein
MQSVGGEPRVQRAVDVRSVTQYTEDCDGGDAVNHHHCVAASHEIQLRLASLKLDDCRCRHYYPPTSLASCAAAATSTSTASTSTTTNAEHPTYIVLFRPRPQSGNKIGRRLP